MKKNVLLIAIMLIVSTFAAKAQKVVQLPEPKKDATMTLMQALQQRKSVRRFAETEVTDQLLSELLWAACGINRPEENKLTAPTAMNRQEISVYVCRKDGAWLWNSKDNTLTKVCDRDLRSMMERNKEQVPAVPIVLVLTGDKTKFAMIDRDFCDVDCGYVSQNVCLAAVALGLATVPRAAMPREELAKALALPEGTEPIINHPIGFAK